MGYSSSESVTQRNGVEITKASSNGSVKPHEEGEMDKLSWYGKAKVYLELAKFRLTALVAFSALAGTGMAPGSFSYATLFFCSLGTALTSSAANSINQYFEVEFDSQMARTKNRPIVKNVISGDQVLKFAYICGGLGGLILWGGCNLLTAVLGVGNIFLYTHAYTPMKRTSIANTWVGSVVGAIPPAMGWTAVTGTFGAGAWLLGLVLFVWQFPHFCALSWNIRKDYGKAGYKMMCVEDPMLCRSTSFEFSVCLIFVSLAFPAFHLTSWYFFFLSLPLNLQLIYLAWRFYQTGDNTDSRSLFKYTLAHLPSYFVVMFLCKL